MGIKLLLADDSITIQKVVGIIFSREDYELTIVDNGNAAVAKARETRPDLLLVDAVMPGMTGYEVCEQVRSDPSLQAVPILLLTGAFDPFDEDKARKSGADDFISKPFESQNLIDKVTTLLEVGRRRVVAPQPAAAAPSVQVPPVETPVAPPSPRPAAVAAPPVPPPAGQPVVEELSAADTEPFTVEVMEGTTDDDLWGAFELEEVAEGEEGESGEVSFEDEAEPFVTEVIEEPPYTFQEEPETTAQPTELAPKWEPVDEEVFSFEEEAAPQSVEAAPEEGFELFEEDAALVEAAAEEPSDFFTFAEIAEPAVAQPVEVASAVPTPEFELEFAPEEEYVPVPEAQPAAAQAAAPAAAVSLPAGSLSEEQLAALVSRISRDIIEKIAWEVVPDLAERIIKDEIRKIKEGR